MSAPREDSRAAVAAELLKWIGQHDPDGSGWFLDEGAPAVSEQVPAPPAEAAAPAAGTAAPTAPATPGKSPEPAAPAAPATPVTAPADDDPFAAECAAFADRALKAIADRRAEQKTMCDLGLADADATGALSGPAPDDPVAALDALRAEVLPCTACGLHATRTNTVFGAGSPRADLMIIGEAPGRDEDLQGEPFVGRSGQLLTKILAAIGLAREEVYIGNILKCRPPDNRDPLPPEVLACEPHLRRQLAIIRPRVICCLGRVAAQTLLRTSTSLSRMRGDVHFYQDIPVMVTYHPAYLLRNPAAKRDTWNDVRKLRALMDKLIS